VPGDKRSLHFAARSARPVVHTRRTVFARRFTRLAPRRLRRRRLGSARVRPPRRDLSSRRLKNDRDASGRLMQPTFSKTSTHALHSERRAATAEPCAATGPGVSTPPSPLTASLIRPAHRALSTQRGPNESWVLTPRHRVAESCAEAPTLNPATKTACPPHQLKKRWIPDPRRLPPVGSPVGPSAGPAVNARVRRPTPLHPLRVTASG
jgi:hypothetical protein